MYIALFAWRGKKKKEDLSVLQLIQWLPSMLEVYSYL